MNLVQSQSVASEHESPNKAAGEFNQFALWMAASLAGMGTAVMLARAGVFRKLLDRLGRGRCQRQAPSKRRSLPMLAGAIVGSNKATIEAVLGPPRAAAVPGIGVVLQTKHAFWQADTWYYPLPKLGDVVVAITFDDDLASAAEFMNSPLPKAET